MVSRGSVFIIHSIGILVSDLVEGTLQNRESRLYVEESNLRSTRRHENKSFFMGREGSECRGTQTIRDVCAAPGQDLAKYATELKKKAQARNSKTEIKSISQYRKKLVKALKELDFYDMALTSLGLITSEWQDFLRSWDEISHLSARDVIAFKETWTDADTEMLLALDSSESNGFVDAGPLTTDAFRQRLPSVKDLEKLQSNKSWAMVGSGANLQNGGMGSSIDEHDHVVRFNNLVDKALDDGKDTGTKTTLHVVNQWVKGQPGLPVFDLEAQVPWSSYCQRVWRHGPLAVPDSPLFIIRPSARCALSDNVGKFTRGFLFYWLFARDLPHVDLYGFQGDLHFQSAHVKDLYASSNRVAEPFVKFEHVVYKQACDPTCKGNEQPMSLSPSLRTANTSNLRSTSSGTQSKKAEEEEEEEEDCSLTTKHHATKFWWVLGAAVFGTCSLAAAATQSWSPRTISIAVCSVFLVMTVSTDMLTTMLAARYGGTLIFNPACMVLLIEISKLVVSVLLSAQAYLGQRKDSGVAASVERASFFSRFGWSSIPACLYAASNIMNYYGIARSTTVQYAIFRETSLVWSACLWRLVFKQPISEQRWFAIWIIMFGCSIKVMPDHLLSGTALDWGVLTVAVQAFLSALAGVTNEFVLKMDVDADINSQNAMLYSLGAVFSLTSLVVFDPSRVQSAQAFFNGFEPWCWCIVFLSTLIGLCASRILKYADAITKGVIVALRGPALMCVSAVMLTSKSATFTVQDLASLMVICPAAMVFLLHGKNQQQPQPELRSSTSSVKSQ